MEQGYGIFTIGELAFRRPFEGFFSLFRSPRAGEEILSAHSPLPELLLGLLLTRVREVVSCVTIAENRPLNEKLL